MAIGMGASDQELEVVGMTGVPTMFCWDRRGAAKTQRSFSHSFIHSEPVAGPPRTRSCSARGQPTPFLAGEFPRQTELRSAQRPECHANYRLLFEGEKQAVPHVSCKTPWFCAARGRLNHRLHASAEGRSGDEAALTATTGTIRPGFDMRLLQGSFGARKLPGKDHSRDNCPLETAAMVLQRDASGREHWIVVSRMPPDNRDGYDSPTRFDKGDP